jgi:uncharacterized protein DUF6895
MLPPLRRRARRICPAAVLVCLAACGKPAPALSTSGQTDSRAAVVAGQETAGEARAAPPRDAYLQSMKRARAWLDVLRVDPIELRAHGIKGKKKLVEQIDAYYSLWKVAGPGDRDSLLARLGEVVKVTDLPAYHDMLSISDEWFKEDSTSYLRAAILMGRLGLDTRQYRAEILKIQDRLNKQMPQRGTHQREAFHWYYRELGLVEPFPLQEARNEGIIAHRQDPATFSDDTAYQLTHEIFVPFEFGDKLDAHPFDDGEQGYLRDALSRLTRRYLSRRNPDLTAELLECQHYLRMQQEPSYREAVAFLLESQNPDGSWGAAPRHTWLPPEYVRQQFVLHTTMVVIGALTEVYDRPMP